MELRACLKGVARLLRAASACESPGITKRGRTMVELSALRPLRLRSLLLLAVYLEVDLLVEEA